MTFLQVKREHRAIRNDKCEWHEFVCGEFLTPQEAANYNVDLRKCRIVDVLNVNKMYWCFGARLCDIEYYTEVTGNADAFDGHILKYHYDISIDIENEADEISEIKWVASFDSDTPLTSKTWKRLRGVARSISKCNETTAWVLITRQERREIAPSGYAAMYAADYNDHYRYEHWFDYTHSDEYLHEYPYHLDRKE